MSVSCCCMDMWLVFLTLILLTRFSQRGSLVSGGGQWADHVLRGCSRLISISRRWGCSRHLPGGWPDRGPWSSGGKWTQRRTALAHAPIPDPDKGYSRPLKYFLYPSPDLWLFTTLSRRSFESSLGSWLSLCCEIHYPAKETCRNNGFYFEIIRITTI